MSWIFGAINASEDVSKIKSVLKEKSLFSFDSNNISILSGGNSETSFSENDIAQQKGWVSVGTGIIEDSSNFSICNKEKWNSLLSRKEVDVKNIFGHYVIIKWDKKNLSIYTDQLGLRDIYISKNCSKIYFSTRIDWLTKFVEAKINFETFGSRWLLYNQISSESVLSNIKRLSAGESAKIDLINLTINYASNDFMPTISDTNSEISIDQFSERLDKLIQVPLSTNRKISLSLSGGMDSRVLLSSLIKNVKFDLWDSHTFGEEDHPDFTISKKIVDQFNFTHKGFNRKRQSPDIYIDELNDFCGETIVNNSASSIVHLNNYLMLRDWKEITIIDGGYGEMWRREFYNRLLIKGKVSVLERKYNKILPHLKLFKADIFSEEINAIMWKGCNNQLEAIFERLPDVEKIGVENWLDLFAFKARLPNYFGHEQSRIDAVVQTYMPFIQIPLLKDLYAIPINKKKNAKLFRQIIKNNSRELSKYWLAKGDITHPFAFTMIQSRLWSMANKKIRINQFHKNPRVEFLQYMGDYVYDILSLKCVKEAGFYDSRKIDKILTNFRTNPNAVVNELDWLLSFEIFRKVTNIRLI
ncbi:MAG: hypothetical protein M0P71_09260 [Melioribacteraceae bacterium]|nr:hypothetical protein [Melioribacteraceae bacterium]